jgi:RHS repeat-associated protein
MQMPGRNASTGDYRYGSNGEEEIDEMYGDGNYVDYKYRGYNSRLGRFFAVDPITSQYPELTPYQFASNNPIWMIELEGLEGQPTSQDNTGVNAPVSNNSIDGGARRITGPIDRTQAQSVMTDPQTPGVIVRPNKPNQQVVFNAQYDNSAMRGNVDGGGGQKGSFFLEEAAPVISTAGFVSQIVGQPNTSTTRVRDLNTANQTIAAANGFAQIAQTNVGPASIGPSATPGGAPATTANADRVIIFIEINPSGQKLLDAQALQTNLQQQFTNAIIRIRQTPTITANGAPLVNGVLVVDVTIQHREF